MTEQSIYCKAALRYASKGYSVFPLKPGTKFPATEHGLHDATTDTAQIESWWLTQPRYNVAIATFGLAVIDGDPGSGDWLQDHPDFLESITTTDAIQNTPRGGRHYMFRQNGEVIRNSQGKVAPHIDVRGDGGYIVVEPSIVDGKRYKWIAELPDYDELQVIPHDLQSWILAATSEPTEITVDQDWQYRGPRHEWFIELVSRMHGAGVHPDIIVQTTLAVNEKQLAEHPDGPRERQQLIGEVERLIDWVNRDPIDTATVSSVHSLTAVDDGTLPDDLIWGVPGFINDYLHYHCGTAKRENPLLGLLSALAFLSVLVGKKVTDHFGNRPNIYLIAIAGSGTGKNRGLEINKSLQAAIGADLCQGKPASGAAMVKAMASRGVQLFQIDEFGKFLSFSNAQGNSHAQQILDELLEFYSCSDSSYLPKAYADQKNTIPSIENPHLSLLGMSTPETFMEGLTAGNLSGGLVARMLIFETERRPRVMRRTQELPESLVEYCRYWHSQRQDLLTESGLSASKPQVVPYTDDAEQLLIDYMHETDSGFGDSDFADSVLSRAGENAGKLALLFACSRSRDRPEIDAQAMRWSIAIVRHCVGYMLRQIGNAAPQSRFERYLMAASELIKRAGETGIGRTELMRSRVGKAVSSHGLDQILKHLIECEQIVGDRIETPGRPRIVYRWTD